MGFNPLRRYRGGKTLDIAIMVSSFIVLVALVIWATR